MELSYEALALTTLQKFLTTVELIGKFNGLCEKGQSRFLKALMFITNLKATQGEFAGQPLGLIPEQVDILLDIYGDLDEEGVRKAREAFILIARKNGKSELAAALILTELFVTEEWAAEIYCAATTKDQATKVLNACIQMIEFDDYLLSQVKIHKGTGREKIVYLKTKSFVKAIGADAKHADSFNAHMVVYDEIHEAPNRNLYDKLITSMGARKEPIFISITTAGKDRKGVWYELFDYSKKLIKGILQNENFLPKLFYLEDDDDWKDEKNWYKANPALGIYRSLKDMRIEYKKALDLPQGQQAFRRLFLNQIIDDSVKWIEYDRWIKCSDTVPSRDLMKAECYGGLDLSSTNDLTALCLCFPKGDKFILKWFYWMPEGNIQKRVERHKVPYDVWKKQGLITATPGDVIDYSFIRQKINELSKIYNIKEIAYDAWNASKLSQDLINDGHEMVVFRQNFTNLSPATKDLQILVYKEKIMHGNNPISNWCASNMILKIDATENIMPDKAKSTEKIDGIVACIMATSRAIRHVGKKSVYESEGVREV